MRTRSNTTEVSVRRGPLSESSDPVAMIPPGRKVAACKDSGVKHINPRPAEVESPTNIARPFGRMMLAIIVPATVNPIKTRSRDPRATLIDGCRHDDSEHHP